MIFKTLQDYDNKIEEINHKINKYQEYVELHPEKRGVKGNIKTLIYVRDELIKERDQNLQIVSTEEINIHLSGESIKNHSISSSLLINFIKKYEELILFIAGALNFGIDKMDKFMDGNFKKEFGYNISPFSSGSFVVTFSPKVYEDSQTTLTPSLNKQSFDKLCDIFNCGEDFEEIIKQSQLIGVSTLIKYKEFMEIIANNKLDISIDEGNRDYPKIELDHFKAHAIYKRLKKFDEENVKTEEIIINGVLYYVNTDAKRCGIKFFDEELDKYSKITHVKFREGLKSKVKDNLDSEVKVTLEKTTKQNVSEDSYKPIFNLVDIQ